MSSVDDQDVEAAKPSDPLATRKRARTTFRFGKSKPIRQMSIPQNTGDGKKTNPYCGVDYGLMRRTSELRNAVEAGDPRVVGEVIDCLEFQKSDGFSIQDASGNGLLQISALKNEPEMIKVLLRKGFKINNVDSNHGTALQAAIYMDYTAVIDVLLDPTNTTKADVNTAGGYYGCALQVAAFKGSKPLIRRLLLLGADVNTCGGKYSSVLQAAARTGLPSIVKLILEPETILEPDPTKRPRPDPVKQAKQVNSKGGVYGSALQAAAKGDYTGQTRFLRCLSRGRVLKQPTKVPRTTSTEEPDYLKVVELLIAKGAIVQYDDGRLGSPIAAAACSGNIDMLKLLVGNDKNPPELRNKPYGYALIGSITQKTVENRLQMAKLLVEAGADVNFETGTGLYNKPLTAAAAVDSAAVIEYLLKKAPDMKDTMNAESGIYGSALRAALSAKAQSAALYLIRQGAEINTTKDEAYGNILHLAVFSKLDEVVELLLSKYKVAVNLRDEAGQTALHIGAYLGYQSTVSILLRYEADPDLEDAWGDTPIKIVENVTERESHPGPDLEDLRTIGHLLLVASAKRNKPKTDDLIHGPPIWKKEQASLAEQGIAKAVFSSPIWNPGLGFKSTIVDFLQKSGDEYLLIKPLPIDDLLYRKGAVPELMQPKESDYQRNLRWYHIPSNNMTWAEMLMKILWTEKHPKTACKSFWGTDPYFVSPDLAPHARFVTPQCGRIIPDSFEGEDVPPEDGVAQDDSKKTNSINPQEVKDPSNPNGGAEVVEKPQNTLFLAIPYLHWESYRSSEIVRQLLQDIKEDSMKHLILRGGKSWRTYEANPKPLARSTVLHSNVSNEEHTTITTNDKSPDDDDELLKQYLFKRWPVHMRRTLDQYYYSYLADTRARDRDQVVTKVRNEELYMNALAITRMKYTKVKQSQRDENDDDDDDDDDDNDDDDNYNDDKDNDKNKNGNDDEDRKKREKSIASRPIFPKNMKGKKPPKDKNSPLVMVDQLWLWVLDKDTIVTCFPARRLEKEDGDLDTENQTDVLETILRYLRSAKRHPIQDAYDLSELIISQCVGILHRSDVVADLDFLKIFGTQADRRVDEVMEKLRKFVGKFEKFMEFVKQDHRISDTYIKKFEKIFSVTDEAMLLREIQDIKDELNMLAAVFQDQLTVLTKVGEDVAEDRKKLRETRYSSFNFQQQSEKHYRHVERMHVQATQAYDTLKDLLDLKQQQANVLEARVNRNQALAANEQGKTIMVFTIVTIIFLPLTFITTVFTLPVLTFPRWDPSDPTKPKPDGGSLKSGYTFGVIVGVTIAVAVPLIVIAFQIKGLQRWWEEKQVLARRKRLEQEKKQAQDDQVKEKTA